MNSRNASVRAPAAKWQRSSKTEEPAASAEARVQLSADAPVNSMSVDVEDYFQVSAFDERVSRRDWGSFESRIPRNVDRILELLEENSASATFFVLGWVADNLPEVVRTIASQGHEIASHGFDHRRVSALSEDDFQQDVSTTRKKLQDVSGQDVVGYRAPSFSLDAESSVWAYAMLEEAGYRYSSSVYPIRHDHYGAPSASRYPWRVANSTMVEIPLSTVRLGRRNLPCAGGGYFRLLPLSYSLWALRKVNRVDGVPFNFYFHPWELDPDQPRIGGLGLKTRFRHYVNLRKFEARLARMLRASAWDRMDRVFASAL